MDVGFVGGGRWVDVWCGVVVCGWMDRERGCGLCVGGSV